MGPAAGATGSAFRLSLTPCVVASSAQPYIEVGFPMKVPTLSGMVTLGVIGVVILLLRHRFSDPAFLGVCWPGKVGLQSAVDTLQPTVGGEPEGQNTRQHAKIRTQLRRRW